MSVQDLRDVLREHAGGPSPANPRRHDQIHARVRRMRRRRRVLAGAAAVAAVVAAAVLVPGVAAPPSRETTAAAVAEALPERFTAPDGTPYRRLALTSLGPDVRRSSVTVPVSGRPLDVGAVCDGRLPSLEVQVLVNGNRTGPPGFSPCRPERALWPLTVPPGVRDVTITFEMTDMGWRCADETRPCEAATPQPGDWGLAVYEWTPPARPVSPEPVRAFPGRLGELRLAASASGVWPQDSTFTFEGVSADGTIGIERLCSGDLAGRMWFRFRIDGVEDPSTVGCDVWKEGSFPSGRIPFDVPKGKRVTVTGQIGLWGEHTNRPVDWSVGLYR
ncbi:hypothetical protein ACIBP6_14635 [Nonomuraea terrae]|uniref:hypothetical protein n=1 Tax=Nonomuraea terrae TaxID=2530383 RepID=UPI0037B1C987